MRIDRVKMAAAMIRADISGIELAKKAGVSRSTVTAVRTGKSCSRETADKLAVGLGVPLADIIKKGE